MTISTTSEADFPAHRNSEHRETDNDAAGINGLEGPVSPTDRSTDEISDMDSDLEREIDEFLTEADAPVDDVDEALNDTDEHVNRWWNTVSDDGAEGATAPHAGSDAEQQDASDVAAEYNDNSAFMHHLLYPSRRSTLSTLQGSALDLPVGASAPSINLDLPPIFEQHDAGERSWSPGQIIMVGVRVSATKDNDSAFAPRHPTFNFSADAGTFAIAERPGIIVAVYQHHMIVLPVLKRYPSFSYKKNASFNEAKARSYYRMSLRVVLPDDDLPPHHQCKRLILEAEGRWQPDSHSLGPLSYHVNLDQPVSLDYDSPYEIGGQIQNIELLVERYQHVHGTLAAVNLADQDRNLKRFIKRRYQECRFHQEHPNLPDSEVEGSVIEDDTPEPENGGDLPEAEAPDDHSDTHEESEDEASPFEGFIPPEGLEDTEDGKQKTWRLHNKHWKCGHRHAPCMQRPPKCKDHTCCWFGSKSRPAKTVMVDEHGNLAASAKECKVPSTPRPVVPKVSKTKSGKKRKAFEQDSRNNPQEEADPQSYPGKKPAKIHKTKKPTKDDKKNDAAIDDEDTVGKKKKKALKKDKKKPKPPADPPKDETRKDDDSDDDDNLPGAGTSKPKRTRSVSKRAAKEPKSSKTRKGSTASQTKRKGSKTLKEAEDLTKDTTTTSAALSRRNSQTESVAALPSRQGSRTYSRIISREKSMEDATEDLQLLAEADEQDEEEEDDIEIAVDPPEEAEPTTTEEAPADTQIPGLDMTEEENANEPPAPGAWPESPSINSSSRKRPIVELGELLFDQVGGVINRMVAQLSDADESEPNPSKRRKIVTQREEELTKNWEEVFGKGKRLG